jgi:1-phosphatidylinositol-3-phosphate 5-kinase
MTRNGTEDTIKRVRAASSAGGKAVTAEPATKGKVVNRPFAKEKGSSRPGAGQGQKLTLRKPPIGPGSKVSHIAKHFERITRDQERANRRYAVIRGRRARPVASSRARVEILDSVRDAIRDESESSDSSSEADDEGEGDDDGTKVADVISESPSESPNKDDSSQSAAASSPEMKESLPTEVNGAPAESSIAVLKDAAPTLDISASVPPSPLLSAANASRVTAPSTPPASDLEYSATGTERNSILRQAISSFWPAPLSQHPRHRMDLESDDPLVDPEHIFRDASMVVRTDEPTSIIALVLKCDQLFLRDD